MGDILIIRFFQVIKRFIVAALLIYSFDVITSSFGVVIPINFFTVLLVGIFDFSAIFGLFIFMFVF